VSSALVFPAATETQAAPGPVRAEQPTPVPVPGSDPAAESGRPQDQTVHASAAQDEVKVQMEPPGEIMVYRFLDQNGTLVLQVPPQQWINLAQAINQELEQEAAPKPATAIEGGKNDGH
jgi:hypothetical protein